MKPELNPIEKFITTFLRVVKKGELIRNEQTETGHLKAWKLNNVVAMRDDYSVSLLVELSDTPDKHIKLILEQVSAWQTVNEINKLAFTDKIPA